MPNAIKDSSAHCKSLPWLYTEILKDGCLSYSPNPPVDNSPWHLSRAEVRFGLRWRGSDKESEAHKQSVCGSVFIKH